MNPIVQILDGRMIVAERSGTPYVQVSHCRLPGQQARALQLRPGIDAQRTDVTDAETVSVLMPWIVAPARRGTRRGSLQWQSGPPMSRCGTSPGAPAERVLRDDEDPSTFYWPTTIEFAYPG